jgi:aminopeptidase-like protein
VAGEVDMNEIRELAESVMFDHERVDLHPMDGRVPCDREVKLARFVLATLDALDEFPDYVPRRTSEVRAAIERNMEARK